MHIEYLDSLVGIAAADWNALDPTGNPFLRHEFLHALEASGCVGPGTGWLPRHVALFEGDALQAALPLYEKSHSYGEYVFDWAWAEAYRRAGLDYYPKLVSAAPFSPVTGPRLLTGGYPEQQPALLQAALALANTGYSSLHTLFCPPDESAVLENAGLLIREGVQFHWRNAGYRDFDDFLDRFSSRKRKQVRKERREALAGELTVECLQGREIAAAHWDVFYRFYLATIRKKGAMPYLTRGFFHELGERLPEACVLFLARQGDDYVAGALSLRSEHALYGRYWGSLDEFPGLHFELCYYQGIDYCIREGLARYEAGAQGEHKIARGFLPVATYSAHWLAHPQFRRAVADFLRRERVGLARYRAELEVLSPFKRELV